MQLFCGKQRGSICVLLTLILVPVLMFSGIIVDASRLFASKTVVSGAGDLTMNAALAQYDKKLKDTYGLTAMAKTPDSPDEQQKLEQMFKEMMKTIPESEDTSSSNSQLMDYYKDEMVQQIASDSTEQNSLGLAQMLYEQMKRNYNLE